MVVIDHSDSESQKLSAILFLVSEMDNQSYLADWSENPDHSANQLPLRDLIP